MKAAVRSGTFLFCATSHSPANAWVATTRKFAHAMLGRNNTDVMLERKTRDARRPLADAQTACRHGWPVCLACVCSRKCRAALADTHGWRLVPETALGLHLLCRTFWMLTLPITLYKQAPTSVMTLSKRRLTSTSSHRKFCRFCSQEATHCDQITGRKESPGDVKTHQLCDRAAFQQCSQTHELSQSICAALSLSSNSKTSGTTQCHLSGPTREAVTVRPPPLSSNTVMQSTRRFERRWAYGCCPLSKHGGRDQLQLTMGCHLDPLEEGDGHAAAVGVDVGQHRDAALPQHLVALRGRWAVGGLDDVLRLHLCARTHRSVSTGSNLDTLSPWWPSWLHLRRCRQDVAGLPALRLVKVALNHV